MWLVKVINALSSQGWAFVLIVFGLSSFAMACFCHPQDVRSTLMNTGTGMVAAGIAMFQHQTKADPADKSAAVDPGQPPAK
jgi:hypothetical protein